MNTFSSVAAEEDNDDDTPKVDAGDPQRLIYTR